MKQISNHLNSHLNRQCLNLCLPEIRFLDLFSYDKSGVSVLSIQEEIPPQEPFSGCADPWHAFIYLDQFLENHYPEIQGQTSRLKYLNMPQTNLTQRLVAQVYRILRSYSLAYIRQEGKIWKKHHCVWVDLVTNPTVYSFHIFSPGLDLLCSFVHYYLASWNRVEPQRYVECMLSSFYSDITDLINDFHDEDCNIRLFQNKTPLNRHMRFACGNAKYQMKDDRLILMIDELHADEEKYPIDFYLNFRQEIYLIPREILKDNSIALSELSTWKIRDQHSPEL